MNKNYALYDATAHIDEDILNDVINSSKKTAKKQVWIKLAAAAACICLLIGIGLPMLNNSKNSASPLGIYACAMSEGGFLRHVLNMDEGIKLNKIELGNGFDGFMFAVELEDKNQMSEVHYLTYKTFPEKPDEEIYALMSEKGFRYFYFIPDPALDKDGFIESFIVAVTSQETGEGTEYGLLLQRDAGEYTITLTSLKSIPEDTKDNAIYPDTNGAEENIMKEEVRQGKEYTQNADGTWECDGVIYKYKLDISGTMPNSNNDVRFIYLSNIEEITFEQAWKASGLSSNLDDYFDSNDAVLLAIKTE